jgi:hypothetical protein
MQNPYTWNPINPDCLVVMIGLGSWGLREYSLKLLIEAQAVAAPGTWLSSAAATDLPLHFPLILPEVTNPRALWAANGSRRRRPYRGRT